MLSDINDNKINQKLYKYIMYILLSSDLEFRNADVGMSTNETEIHKCFTV